MSKAFLHLIDDELCEVLALEDYRCDHGINIQGVEQLIFYSQGFSFHLEVIHRLHSHYEYPHHLLYVVHHLRQGVGVLPELSIQVFLNDLALKVEVQLAEESLAIWGEVMLHLPAEPNVILQFADCLFIEALQLRLEMGYDRLVLDKKGVFEGWIALDELVPHETVITFAVVNTVRKVKKEVALSDEFQKVPLFVFRRHGIDGRSILVHTFLRVLIIDETVIEVVGLVMRERSNRVPQNLLFFQLESIIIVSFDSVQTDIFEFAVGEGLGEAGEQAASLVLLRARQTEVVVLTAVCVSHYYDM